MKDKLIHGCFFITMAVLILLLCFIFCSIIDIEKREKVYQEHIKECERCIKAMRQEDKKMNSSQLGEFIIIEDVLLTIPSPI